MRNEIKISTEKPHKVGGNLGKIERGREERGITLAVVVRITKSIERGKNVCGRK